MLEASTSTYYASYKVATRMSRQELEHKIQEGRDVYLRFTTAEGRAEFQIGFYAGVASLDH